MIKCLKINKLKNSYGRYYNTLVQFAFDPNDVSMVEDVCSDYREYSGACLVTFKSNQSVIVRVPYKEFINMLKGDDNDSNG